MLAAASTDKDVIFLALFDIDRVAYAEPVVQFLRGAGRDGHDALLIALTRNADKTIFEIEVG